LLGSSGYLAFKRERGSVYKDIVTETWFIPLFVAARSAKICWDPGCNASFVDAVLEFE
jgi:hypothetical protein